MTTTQNRTLHRDVPGEAGWAELRTGPGEQHVGGPPDAAGRVLGAVVHLTDLHLCDAESPARQEYLDHLGDPGAPYASVVGVIGTYRPQEILTTQVATAALDAVGRLDGRAPVTGARLDAVLLTGDVTDNAQRNELRWYTELMSGRPILPASGDPRRSSWVGARGAGGWWPHFWHPDGAPDGEADDDLVSRYGFPVLPGLVEAARREHLSPGTDLPWLTVHGNHDALLQGTVAPSLELCELAVGGRRVVGLGHGQTPLVVLEAAAAVGPARYTHDATAPTVRVRADAERQLVGSREMAAAVAAAGGAPFERDRNRWARDVGELRVIALDTVNPHGGWQGSVEPEQLAWLAQELHEARGRYVVLTSHHPSWSLTNAYAPPGEPTPHLADEVLSLALAHPGVIAWVAGHVHTHAHLWHQAPGRDGGLWEITTSSLIDWPQQLRVLEVVREPRGTIALTSTVVDHAGTVHAVGAGAGSGLDLGDPRALAGVSRVLAANDHRLRSDPRLQHRAAGGAADRNVVWRLPDPYA